MSGDQQPPSQRSDEQVTPQEEWRRKRRLAEIFGDALPETTGDDREAREPTDASDAWLRSQVPPHHGE